MNTVDVPRILESVASVTEQRDMDRMRASLIQTLREVLPARAVGFVSLGSELVSDAEGDALTFPSAIPDTVRARLVVERELVARLAEGCLHVTMVGPDEGLAVLLECSNEDQVRTFGAFVRLYVNFLNMIRDSEQDRLTGLKNRRSFDLTLARVSERAVNDAAGSSPARPWWLALFDVDHFKRINDRFGHLYGDEVLLLIAQLVRSLFGARDNEHCFRYGGEEFAILLRRDSVSAVQSAMECLRQTVATYVFPQVGQVTISIGCAPLLMSAGPVDAIERADHALYAAKRAGRNRVIVAEPSAIRPNGEVELF